MSVGAELEVDRPTILSPGGRAGVFEVDRPKTLKLGGTWAGIVEVEVDTGRDRRIVMPGTGSGV